MAFRTAAWAAAILAAGAVGAGAEPQRIEIKLSHKGDVFGESPEFDKQYAREALQVFKDLKPDPKWVEKLKALPDNTWMRCPPNGDQWREDGHGEVPFEYVPEAQACFIMGGCGGPGYSSDCWFYHTGANRWIQMWPNWVKGEHAARLNKGPYPGGRPAGRCFFGLAYDTDRKLIVLRGGANSGSASTWTWNPPTNEWKPVAPPGAGFGNRYEDNCVGFVPGFGTVEVGGDRTTAKASTWVYGSTTDKWGSIQTVGAPPGGNNCRPVWASGPQRLMYFARGQLWAFDPKALTWEDVTPKEGPKPGARERHGITYDSANDVLVVTGGEHGEQSRALWAYSFKDKKWTDMKPGLLGGKGGEKFPDAWGSLCYDPEHNVFVASHPYTWVYRYKAVAEKLLK